MKKHVDANPEETAFFQPFNKMPDSISQEDQARLKSKAIAAISSSIQPGMKRLMIYIKDEYMQHTRPEIGAMSLPNGAKFYEQCIKFHTSTNMTAQEIHEKGIEEVARIEKAMTEIKDNLGFKDKKLSEFNEILRDDPKFYYDSPEACLQGFKDLVNKKIQPKLKTIFSQDPVHELLITESPQADAPAAFYIAGTADGSRPGTFFANIKKYKGQ